MFEAEPLAQLGVGIVTYVHILWVLFVSFLFFSILLLPTSNHYEGGTGYMGSNPKLIQYETGMIGNMGYSSTQCVSVPTDLGKINIQCPYGDVGVITHYGVNLSDDTANNCVENDDIASCKPDSQTFTDALSAAKGKHLKVVDYSGWKGLYAESASKTSCNKPGDSRLFVQFTCEQSAENQSMKYNQMCLISGTAILIALLFTVTMRYLFQGGKITKIDWDMATVTAGDYSVEIDIYKENYDEWMKNSYEAANGILENNPDKSPALALKETLIE